MNADHPRFAQWDAAYVVGALSADDRSAFEEHLDACPDCRRAVAELAPTVGLLSRLTLEDVESSDDAPQEDHRAAEIIALARERSRSRRLRTRILVLAAAVVLVVAAIATPFAIGALVRPADSFALESTVDIPLEANVRLTSVGWGTRIELDCRYPSTPGEDSGTEWTYALAVVDKAGEASTVSTWRAGPGSAARLSAATALDVADISRVEIRSMSGAVLMGYDLAG